jgi:hypothetical protein
MSALDDVSELTAARFRRMSPGNHDGLPRVDTTGLPPGPRWPVLVQTAALLRFRHWIHPYLHRTYGDTFTLRLAPGGRPLVFFTRPEDTREIFAGDPEVFYAGKGNAILGPIMGEHSLLLQDSAEHKRARKLLMPAFNGHALRGYRDLVREVAEAHVSDWRSGEEFRSLDRMNALTLDVILRVVFGVTDERRLAQLRPRVNATVDIGPVVLLGWGYPRAPRATTRPTGSATPSCATSWSPCCWRVTRPPRPRWRGRSTRPVATGPSSTAASRRPSRGRAVRSTSTRSSRSRCGSTRSSRWSCARS